MEVIDLFFYLIGCLWVIYSLFYVVLSFRESCLFRFFVCVCLCLCV